MYGNKECTGNHISRCTICIHESPVKVNTNQFSFLITDKCNRIVPRVGHLNRAGHLFLKRFERAVDFNNFRILLGLDSQDFHNSTSQNQNINRAVSSENAICDVGTHRLDHSTEDRPQHSINTIRPYAANAAPLCPVLRTQYSPDTAVHRRVWRLGSR